MDKLTNIQHLIENIRLKEGANFECNENSIVKEYAIKEENDASLAIKILSIFGGFVATIAFLGFLLIAGLYESEFGLLLVGIGFIISAIWLNKVYNKLIIDTFSITSYAIGFVLLAFALHQLNVYETIINLLIISIAIGALFITQNYMLSFISVLIISGSLLNIIFSNNVHNLIHLYIVVYTFLLTYFYLKEAKLIALNSKLCKLYNPIRIGLVFSLLFGFIAIGKKQLIPIDENYNWITSIIIGCALLFIINSILKIIEVKALKSKIILYALSSLFLISTVFAPAISGAILIILISFLVNYKTGFVIGIVSFIYFISQYYYDLNFTLLTKSILLFSSGIIFLLFYVFTSKTTTNEKV